MVPEPEKNMMRKPAIFLHIQKTAGTSMVDLVRRHYRNRLISHGTYLEKIPYSTGNNLKINEQVIAEFRGIPFVSGHFGYDFASIFMPDRYSFTFLRDPIERILSFYFFCRSQNPAEYYIYRLSQENLLNEFLEKGLKIPEIGAFILNHQVWQLACGFGNRKNYGYESLPAENLLELALKHLENFSYVGFTETFEEDRDKILFDLQVPIPPKKIAENTNPYRPTKEDLAESTLALLDQLIQLDQILYQKAWAKRKETQHNLPSVESSDTPFSSLRSGTAATNNP